MTTADIIESALVTIEGQRPQDVYAGRRNICGGVQYNGREMGQPMSVLFRRLECGAIHCEIRTNRAYWKGPTYHELPVEQQVRAAKVLRRL